MSVLLWERARRADDGCLVWTGPLDRNGYAKSGNKAAYRLAYEQTVGPIPEGYEIDHLCRNRACIEPTHLEAVTLQENRRRSVSANKQKTHCLNGHPYDEGNTYRWGTWRACRVCNAAAAKRHKARKRAEAAQ